MVRPAPRSGSLRRATRQRAAKINDRPRQNPAYRPALPSFAAQRAYAALAPPIPPLYFQMVSDGASNLNVSRMSKDLTQS